jgi:hypothetical protein
MMPIQPRPPRVAVETLCNELVADRDQYALVTDLSAHGLCLQRPLRGRLASRIVQLEFELPEVDEIVWARGEICFDRLRPAPTGPVRSSGIRLVAAAARHLRLLRDWVIAAAESRAALREEGDPASVLQHASHWAG